MRLTKFGHSCVRLEEDGSTIVLDPGVFTDVPAALAGAQAVLITHEHPDHIDLDALSEFARTDQALQLFAPAGVAASLAEFADRVTVTEAGTPFQAAGFGIETVGGQHAVIHPLIPVIANVGYVINDTVYHPGDSFIVAPKKVNTVLVPLHAPWSKTAEVIDFTIATRAEQAFQIHDALLTDIGLKSVEGHLQRFGKQYGTAFEHIGVGDSVDL